MKAHTVRPELGAVTALAPCGVPRIRALQPCPNRALYYDHGSKRWHCYAHSPRSAPRRKGAAKGMTLRQVLAAQARDAAHMNRVRARWGACFVGPEKAPASVAVVHTSPRLFSVRQSSRNTACDTQRRAS